MVKRLFIGYRYYDKDDNLKNLNLGGLLWHLRNY